MPTREPTAPGSRKTSRASVRELLSALSAADGQGQADLAVDYVRESTNMEVLRPALAVLQAWADPAVRPLLRERYAWCERTPEKHDSGGFVRASIIRAMQPVIQLEDLPILQRALVTYQMVGLYEVCAELRTAALLTLADLDPDLATYYAARFLRDPLNSNSGEPALSSVRLLAAQQQLAPLFGAVASPSGTGDQSAWLSSNSEVTGEVLRSLVDLPESLVPLLIAEHRDSEDEQVLLGLYDLLLGHPARANWIGEIEHFLRTTRLLDLYGLVVTQIVVTRDESLIDLLRKLREETSDRVRHELLSHALEHA